VLDSAKKIERDLLKGQPLKWIDPDSGASDELKLNEKKQRSLLNFLLENSERNSSSLSDSFIEKIKSAYLSDDDPADAIPDTELISVLKQSWMLHKIETYGFGGINFFENKEFSYEIAGDSVCLEGENGSGKSSLISAIQWALTGQVIKNKPEHSDAEIPVKVYDDTDRNIGTWPPIASYPHKADDFKKQPIVWVRLTFFELTTSESIIAERRLEKGIVSSDIDPAIETFSTLFEPAILMPSRLPHIDLSGRTTDLVETIQKLTGLEPLAELGDFVSGTGLGHSARSFLKYAKANGLDGKKSQFETAIQTAHDVFEEDLNNILRYKTRIESEDLDEELAELEKILSEAVSEKLSVLKDELPGSFKPEDSSTKIRDSVNSLTTTLSEHKTVVIPSAVKLSEVQDSLNSSLRSQIDTKIFEIEIRVADAIKWHEKRTADQKLKLKLIAAQYHLKVIGDLEVTDCPLCENSLHDQEKLSEELKVLKEAGGEAQKSFEDAIRELKESLTSLMPNFKNGQLIDYAGISPRADFIKNLEEGVLKHPSVKDFLVGIETYVSSSLVSAKKSLPDYPEQEFTFSLDWNSYAELSTLKQQILNVKRLMQVSQWWEENKGAYTVFWSALIGSRDPKTGQYPKQTVQGKLCSLTDALEQSRPFEVALTNIKLGRNYSKIWQEIRKEQDLRESISEALKPLSKLRKYVECQSKEALKTLSQDISKIYGTICSSERFKYQSTRLSKKNIIIEGQLNDGYKLDATLVANTSWLRAVLWSFVFALRNATLDKIGYNPFPLMILDDPQNTFDTKHKRKWAEYICNLSKLSDDNRHATQFFLTSHDILFANYLLTLDRFNGSFGYISHANTATKVLVIAGGMNIQRKWNKAESTQMQSDGYDYVSYMRIYVETILQIILHGEAPNVGNMLLSDLRGLLEGRKQKGIPPFNRPEFEKLINHTHKAKEHIKLIQETHHSDNGDIGYQQAKDIKGWWDKIFEKIIHDAFAIYREYRLINGEPRSLFAESTSVKIFEGHKNVLTNINIKVVGKVAALTDGRHCDGCFHIEENTEPEQVSFFNHSAYQLTSNTLEPVASIGDMIIVSNIEKVYARDLVVTSLGNSILARRYNLVDEHLELVALVSQAINPDDIKPTHVVHASSIEKSTKKIVAVLYGNSPLQVENTNNEIIAIDGENSITQAVRNTHLFEIKGRSAEPYALDGQHLLVGNPESDFLEILKMNGDPVLAVDSEDNTYFKRLRVFNDGAFMVLESLDLSGKEESMLFSNEDGAGLPSIQTISPVKGVIFDLPQ
jgi:energy-coupling factor transporter ATP-binding protein EcfA2